MQFTRKIVLSLLIIVLCSAMAFASEESPTSEQTPLEVPTQYYVDQELAVYRDVAATLAAANPQYTTDDIYDLLLTTNSTLSTISSRVNTSNTRLNTINTTLTSTNSKLDTLLYGVLGTNTGTPALDIISTLYLMDGSGNQYTLSELVGMCWSRLGNIDSSLGALYTISNQAGSLISETQRTNAKLEYVFSAIEDTINIKWYASAHAYNGTSKGLDLNFLTSNDSAKPIYVSYDFNSGGLVTPQLYRITFPVRYANPYSGVIKLSNIYVTLDFNNFYTIPIPEHFIEFTTSGCYLYLFDWQPYTSNSYHYYFELDTPNTRSLQFRTDYDTGVYTIPFDTLDYQIIRTAFNSASSAVSDKSSLDQLVNISSQLSILAQSSQSGADAAEALADYFVSPQKQAAEDASSQVINSTLNNFTGSGSGAAKSSDSNAMKDVSGSIQNGLNSGGSVSGATGVFNSGSDFWGWFTQQNSNYINNPYPAPVVSPTRGAGDEIVDFLTPNSNELQDLLRQGGDQR